MACIYKFRYKENVFTGTKLRLLFQAVQVAIIGAEEYVTVWGGFDVSYPFAQLL